MTIKFHKYQGTGNDFVMIDNRSNAFSHDLPTITKLCDRKFGVGADGLILIENHESLDFEMVYFNADGSKSLCGNGSRCAVNFAHFLGIIANDTNFQTIDGAYYAKIENERVHLKMSDQKAPKKSEAHYFLNNGSPHHIEFVDEVDQINVYQEGRERRHRDTYAPDGCNVNFVEILDAKSIYVRTFERGVEDETLSCGTGIAASALAAVDKGLRSPITIQSKGGNLEVRFERTEHKTFENIWLIGPAEMVFEGIFQR
jgi:diaminopimelate epimerase